MKTHQTHFTVGAMPWKGKQYMSYKDKVVEALTDIGIELILFSILIAVLSLVLISFISLFV